MSPVTSQRHPCGWILTLRAIAKHERREVVLARAVARRLVAKGFVDRTPCITQNDRLVAPQPLPLRYGERRHGSLRSHVHSQFSSGSL